MNVRVRLNHTFDGDLAISLVAPDGTSVPLATNRGGSGDNFGSGANDCSGTPTVFDDAAATAMSAGVAPFTASFRPESPLAAMNGKAMSGVWKIRVADTGALDVGTLGCATLEIQPQLYFCCGVAGTPIINAAPPATVVAESVVPANNAPDPDETVTMSFPLRNVGTGLTSNLVATLLPGGGSTRRAARRTTACSVPSARPMARNFTFVPSAVALQHHRRPSICRTARSSRHRLVRHPPRLDRGRRSRAARTPHQSPSPASAQRGGGAPSNPYPSAINISA